MNESSNMHSIAASTRDSYRFGDGTYHVLAHSPFLFLCILTEISFMQVSNIRFMALFFILSPCIYNAMNCDTLFCTKILRVLLELFIKIDQ